MMFRSSVSLVRMGVLLVILCLGVWRVGLVLLRLGILQLLRKPIIVSHVLRTVTLVLSTLKPIQFLPSVLHAILVIKN